MWIQREIGLAPRPRGMHLVTNEILEQIPEVRRLGVGLVHVFIQHTSASLTLNENASPDVRTDLERQLNEMIPEGSPYFRHTLEGPDDMPAHVKASLLGNSVLIPVGDGRLRLGTWQGVYLCEHRNHGGSRRLIVTLWGE